MDKDYLYSMIRLLIITSLLCPSLCFADEWTKTDTAMQILYSGLHIMDWNQTIQIAEDENRREGNQILGASPNKDQVNLYFATTLLGHYYIAKKLDKPYRTLWQIVWINIQHNVVNHNQRKGLHFKLNF